MQIAGRQREDNQLLKSELLISNLEKENAQLDRKGWELESELTDIVFGIFTNLNHLKKKLKNLILQQREINKSIQTAGCVLCEERFSRKELKLSASKKNFISNKVIQLKCGHYFHCICFLKMVKKVRVLHTKEGYEISTLEPLKGQGSNSR